MRAKGRVPFWTIMVIAFIALQLLDGTLTAIGVYRYGVELEANPIVAHAFTTWGVWQSVLAAKAFSFLVFFGILWYCLRVRWSTLDVVGLMWKRKPKRDKAYAMACFNVLAVVTTMASLYAGGGWVYLLIWFGLVR